MMVTPDSRCNLRVLVDRLGRVRRELRSAGADSASLLVSHEWRTDALETRAYELENRIVAVIGVADGSGYAQGGVAT